MQRLELPAVASIGAGSGAPAAMAVSDQWCPSRNGHGGGGQYGRRYYHGPLIAIFGVASIPPDPIRPTAERQPLSLGEPEARRSPFRDFLTKRSLVRPECRRSAPVSHSGDTLAAAKSRR